MDARGSPGRILARQGTNGSPHIVSDHRPATALTARSKAPVHTETFPMPANHGGRLHNKKGLRPMRPRSTQQHPEQSIGMAQVSSLGPAFQNAQLLPQGDYLKSQIMSRPNKAAQPGERALDQTKHTSVLIASRECVAEIVPSYFWRHTTFSLFTGLPR